jgi:MoxR-like ATPase
MIGGNYVNKTIIRTDQHVFVPGMTGSGKTFLCESYLNAYKNVIVLDTKGFFNWKSSIEPVPVFTHLKDLGGFREGRAIYRPDFTELNEDFYNAFFKYIYERRNTIVYIDELMEVAPSSRTYPLYLKGLLTRGREMNIGVWMSTQRPRDIPILCFTQSTHFFVFYLQLQEDRHRLAVATEQPTFEINAGTLKSHIFWYYDATNAHTPRRGVLNIK